MMFRPLPAVPVAGALAAAALLAAACSAAGGGGSAAPAGLEKTNLTVAAVPALDSAGLYIAQERGLFAAQGLHVTIESVDSSATVVAGQLAGKYDVTEGAYVAYMLADAQQDAGLKVLAPASNMGPLTQEVMVPAGSPIQTVSQLKGKTIGLNVLDNVGQVLVSSLLSDNGISPSDVHFVAVPFPDMATALKTHEVDAAWLPEPFITDVEESIGATPLADVDQGAAQNLPVAGYVATQSWLDKYPETAAAFRRAVLEAQGIASNDPGAIVDGMVAYGGVSRTTAQIEAAPIYPQQSDLTLLQRTANLMEQFGLTQQVFNAASMIHS
jgi:NitT/TauT family transport system substrate-binding protein